MTDNPLHIDPAHTALLVMDYQTGIISMTGAEALLPRMAGVIATARNRGIQIGYVRVAFTDTDYEAIPEANQAFRAAAAGRRFHDQDPETAIPEAIAPRPEDIVVRKTRVGAFSTTDLHQQLGDRNIDTLLLAGITTSGVVLSTVRDGADRDYRLIVLADCCVDPDPQVQEALMTRVFPRQATVIGSAAFLQSGSESRDGEESADQ